MNDQINKLFSVIVYFFTPEDSATPIQSGGGLSFNIEYDMIGIGSAKALFWVMNTIILLYLISLL